MNTVVVFIGLTLKQVKIYRWGAFGSILFPPIAPLPKRTATRKKHRGTRSRGPSMRRCVRGMDERITRSRTERTLPIGGVGGAIALARLA